MFKIGIIGVGNMGEAILKGLLTKAGIESKDIVVFDLDRKKVDMLVSKYEVGAASDVSHLVKLSKIIFVAVKPKDFDGLMNRINSYLDSSKILVSVMAGINIEKIKRYAKGIKIVRTMPNTPALIGEGVIGVSFDFEEEDLKGEIVGILSSLGLVIEVKEDLLDTITGLSGSGPAFVFTFIDALAMAGVKMGLSYQDSLNISIQTVVGSGLLLKELNEHPCILRDKVASPSGTTIYGLHQLERKGFKDAVITAVEEATLRSKKLSNQS